jgi:hypothetical protein
MIPIIKESFHREEEIRISHENARKPFWPSKVAIRNRWKVNNRVIKITPNTT